MRAKEIVAEYFSRKFEKSLDLQSVMIKVMERFFKEGQELIHKRKAKNVSSVAAVFKELDQKWIAVTYEDQKQHNNNLPKDAFKKVVANGMPIHLVRVLQWEEHIMDLDLAEKELNITN